ncbi:hypothetical protein [Burkholderia cenocepacia]|uniref:hypothetical protein n=1 Tax=Burkholderia cenocepacia TaxID=95486 RepID=UPI0022386AA3|nr:hypothetical protein [Burkholderia cenocepacia]MCW5156445.1 hypothetical protein [Burkholderia cenocepacia]
MNQNEFKNRLIFDIVYNNIAFTTAQEEASDLIEFIRYYAKSFHIQDLPLEAYEEGYEKMTDEDYAEVARYIAENTISQQEKICLFAC